MKLKNKLAIIWASLTFGLSVYLYAEYYGNATQILNRVMYNTSLGIIISTNNFNTSQALNAVFDAGNNALSVHLSTSSSFPGDNLGNHIATKTLNMSNYDIENVSTGTFHTINVSTINPNSPLYINNGANNVLFTGTGNVGIGTQNPLSILDILGSGGGRYIRATEGNIIFPDDGYVNFMLGSNTRASRIMIGQDITHSLGLTWIYNPTPSAATALIETYGGSNDITMQVTGGNLGIGTTLPNSKLDVNGVIRTVGYGTPSSGAGLEMYYYTPGQRAFLLCYDRGASQRKPISVEALDLQLNMNSVNQTARFTSTGLMLGLSVGPQNRLDVDGGAVIGDNYAGIYTAPTNGLAVEGNVGIGILAPTDKMQVNGDTFLNGKTYMGDTKSSFPFPGSPILDIYCYNSSSTITEALRFTRDGSPAIAENGSISFLVDRYYAGDLYANNRLNIKMGQSYLVQNDVLTLFSEGKVGINIATTTVPTEALEVNGNIKTKAVFFDTNAYTVGIDTPIAVGQMIVDSNFDLWIATGTSTAWDWEQH